MIKLQIVYRIMLWGHAKTESRPSVDMWLTRNVSNQLAQLDLSQAFLPQFVAETQTNIYSGTVNYTMLLQPVFRPQDEDGEASAATDVDVRLMGAQQSTASQKPKPAVDWSYVLENLGACRLNIDPFLVVENEHGELCRNQAGCSRVALAELFGPDARSHTRIGARVRFPMVESEALNSSLNESPGFLSSLTQMTRARPSHLDKGMIIFHTDECKLWIDDVEVSDPRFKGRINWRVLHMALSPCEQFIQNKERTFSPPAFRCTFTSMNNVGIFRFVGRAGVAPADIWVDAPRGHSKMQYFSNVARLALRRMGYGDDDQRPLRWNLRDPQDCRFASYWLAHMLSMYVQYGDYISDLIYVFNRSTKSWEKMDVEYFYQLRLRGGQGDCEDAAAEFLIEANELTALMNPSDPLVRLAKQVLGAFYMMMLLDGISGREINLSEPGAELGAHMNSALVNKGKMLRWLGKRGLANKSLEPSLAELEFAKPFPPIIMLEGTGPLDANGVENCKANARGERRVAASLDLNPSLNSKLRPLFHCDSSGKLQSQFYKTAKVAMTDHFLKRGGSECMWMLCKEDPQTGERTASVEFQTIAAGSDQIVAIPQPALSAEQLSLLKQYVLDLHPTPSLLSPSQGGPEVPIHIVRAREQMAWLAEQFASPRYGSVKVGRPITEREALNTGADNKEVMTIRISKYHHYDEGRQFVSKILSSFDPQNGAINKQQPLREFSVLEEQVTNDRGGYWMFFFF